jgi:S1 RNA binding domain/Zc3h12a-like Ribonuclease NYN domain
LARQHFVVDGSNIATEGRTTPSLVQLVEALDAFRTEHPGATVTVVVDASFPHRIAESERDAYEAAVIGGDLVSPPAGAIGRGDGFLLQIADRTGGAVLSNDSFQEFHGTYRWLFDTGRLIGAKPVPSVGWIFSLRSPVEGPKSRKAVRDAGQSTKKTPKVVVDAIRAANADALEPEPPKRRRKQVPVPGTVNDPAPYLRFVDRHPPGSELEGEVDAYTSHGAFVDVGGVRGYLPLAAMGDPPPASAREALRKGDRRRFVVQAFDAPRRGVELAIPEFARVSGTPTEETVEASIEEGSARTRRRRRQRQAAKEKARTAAATPKKASKKKPAKKAAKPAKKPAKKAAKPAKKSAKPAKKSAKPAKKKRSSENKARPAKKRSR